MWCGISRAIEKLTSNSRETLQTLADMKVRAAETTMKERSADTEVQQRLRTDSKFQKDVILWLPQSRDDGGEPQEKSLGPAWALGD